MSLLKFLSVQPDPDTGSEGTAPSRGRQQTGPSHQDTQNPMISLDVGCMKGIRKLQFAVTSSVFGSPFNNLDLGNSCE